ncbi:hypothetical protein [Nonomuraea sp. NPDC049784]|uniref:hypothetical protein n=1 Tax=Nonomuraea sp. NPDC049784 TaxID=3154361 RepID=UPI0033C1F243
MRGARRRRLVPGVRGASSGLGLWGAVEGMPCEHGCMPEGGLMPDPEAHRLLDRAKRI